MIKKLLTLIFDCVKHPFKSYYYGELWYYLTRGYTTNDFTDFDVYLLDTISEMGSELLNVNRENYKECDCCACCSCEESGSSVMCSKADVEFTEDQQNLLDLVVLARKLSLDVKNEIYTPEEKIKHRKEFFTLFEKCFFKMWF